MSNSAVSVKGLRYRVGVAALALLFLSLVLSSRSYAFDFLSSPTQLSNSGPAGDANYDSTDTAVAYNSNTGQYLSVWVGDSSSINTNEIFGRLVDSKGAVVSDARQYSTMGSDTVGDDSYDAYSPSVAYNSTDDEFLVVWYGDTKQEDEGLTNSEYEVWAQRVSSLGVPKGSPFRVSYTTDELYDDVWNVYDAGKPSVAYNPDANRYLIVWEDNSRVSALSCPASSNGLMGVFVENSGSSLSFVNLRQSESLTEYKNARISIAPLLADSVDCDIAPDLVSPSVVYNPSLSQFLVVWYGDMEVAGAFNIYGITVDSETTGSLDSSRFQISSAGGSDSSSSTFADYDAKNPSIAYDSDNNKYLVVWVGDDASYGDNQYEVFGQYLYHTGVLNNSRFKISESTATLAVNYVTTAYNSVSKEFLTVWSGEAADGQELYGERLDKDGNTVGSSDFKISDINEATSSAHAVRTVGLATASDSENFLPVWSQTDDANGLVDGEYEIFSRALGTASGDEEPIDEPVDDYSGGDEPPVETPPTLKFSVKADSKQSLKETGGVFVIKASCNVECLSYGSVRGKGKAAKKKGKAAKLAKKVSSISKSISEATQRVAVYRTVKIRLSKAEQKNLKKVIASKSCKKKGKKRKCKKGSAYLKVKFYATDGNTTQGKSAKIKVTK